MKQISYIYKSGRTQRLEESDLHAKEFYYSLEYFQDKYPNLKVIEDKDGLNKKYLLIDRLLQKFKLPINFNKIVSKENLETIKNSDIIFSTNPGLAITLSPFLRKYKKKKNIKFFTINSGIFTNIDSSKIGSNPFKNIFIKYFLKTVDFIVFTSKTEHKVISNIFTKFNNKFIHQSFCIDTDFWVTELIDSKEKNGILFIGNDFNRDFSSAIDIARRLPNIEFKFVTSQIKQSNKLPENITLIKGNWNENILSDEEIKDLYKKSRLVFLPVQETLVASGQSVAMQSMATGTPVMISKTSGFWDFDNFINDKNIFLLEENSINSWTNKINEVYENYDLLDKLSANGQELIRDKFNLNKFSERLEELFTE